MAHPGGRPLKFQSVEELQQKIDAYFLECEENGDPLTITDLADALDTSRETLLDYEDREEFSDAIKRAKTKIEGWTEKQLFKLKNPAGAIFNLTNNYRRWSNKQTNELTGPNGGPLQTQAVDMDWDKLAQDEPELFAQVVELKEKLKGRMGK